MNHLITPTFLLLSSTLLLSQGPLTPPPGAPAPSMRSLQEIWARIEEHQALIDQIQLAHGILLTEADAFAWQIETVDSLPLVTEEVGWALDMPSFGRAPGKSILRALY